MSERSGTEVTKSSGHLGDTFAVHRRCRSSLPHNQQP